MLDLSPEISSLEERNLISRDASLKLRAVESRSDFSIWPELKFVSWISVITILTGAGLLLRQHLDSIGDLTIALAIGVIAALCFWIGWRERARERRGIVFEYVPLLGALLVAADVVFLESRYHVFDERWRWHLLIIAAIQFSVAYALHHTAVFRVALLALAGWAGVDEEGVFWGEAIENANTLLRGGAAASAVALLHHWKLDRWREFRPIADGVALHLLLLGALFLSFDDDSRWAGVALVTGLAAVMHWWGRRQRRESFVIFSAVYAAIALEVAIVETIDVDAFMFLFILIVNPLLLLALYMLHRGWERK